MKLTQPKILLVCSAIFAVLPCAAQSSDSSKYARCAGSYEVHKCRAQVDLALSETPDAKRARIANLERDRLSAAEAVVKKPTTPTPASAQFVRSEPAIGMSEYQAATSTWGQPEEKNRTETRAGIREQWVYGDGSYLYLDNGKVTAITSRR